MESSSRSVSRFALLGFATLLLAALIGFGAAPSSSDAKRPGPCRGPSSLPGSSFDLARAGKLKTTRVSCGAAKRVAAGFAQACARAYAAQGR